MILFAVGDVNAGHECADCLLNLLRRCATADYPAVDGIDDIVALSPSRIRADILDSGRLRVGHRKTVTLMRGERLVHVLVTAVAGGYVELVFTYREWSRRLGRYLSNVAAPF